MVWIFIFSLIFFLAYQGDESRRYSKLILNFYRVSLVLVLSFISALGSPSGQDHFAYAALYNGVNIQNIFDFSSFDYYEPGYVLFNGIFRFLGVPEATFFFIIGLFINGAIIHFIYNYKYPVINVFIMIIGGTITMQENIVRQEMAAAFFLLAFPYLLNGNIKKYIIILVVASTFHLTALFLLILAPLCIIDIEKRGNVIKILMIGILVVSLLIALGYVYIPFLEVFNLASRYDTFMNADENIGMKFSVYRIIFFNIMAFFMIFFAKRKYYMFVVILVLYAVIANVSVALPNVSRIYPYFDLISITLLLLSLGGDVLKININKIAPIIRLALSCLIFYVVLAQYVFAKDVALLSTTYSLSDFF